MNRLRTIRRSAYLPDLILGLAHSWSSYPRLLLEVFVRRNFGQFYFSMAAVWRAAVILFVIPHVLYWVKYNIPYGMYGKSVWEIYASWYAFIVAFLIMSFIRWGETKKMAKNKLYPYNHVGEIHPLFFKIKIFGEPTEKLITCVYEPIFFFLSGYILVNVFGQQIGKLIEINSLFYSLGNYAEYRYDKQAKLELEFELQQNEIKRRQYQEKDVRSLMEMNRNSQMNSPAESSNDDIPTAAL